MATIARRAARAILIDNDHRLLLIKRTRPGQAPYWTSPGGGVEPDDPTVEQAMVRELREELSAEVSRTQQVFLISNASGDRSVNVQHFFVCYLDDLNLEQRSGPEFAEPGRGAYHLDRVTIGDDGLVPVELKPAELKAFIEANWTALVDAISEVPPRLSPESP